MHGQRAQEEARAKTDELKHSVQKVGIAEHAVKSGTKWNEFRRREKK